MSLKKKTPRSGSRSGLGFIHTWPKPGPRPNLFKGKIPKYPHQYIHIIFFLKKKKKKTPYFPNPISLSHQPSYTHITLLSHSTALTPSHSPHIILLSPTSNLCHHRPLRAPPIRLFSLFLSISAHTVSHSHSQSHSLSSSAAQDLNFSLLVQAFTTVDTSSHSLSISSLA